MSVGNITVDDDLDGTFEHVNRYPTAGGFAAEGFDNLQLTDTANYSFPTGNPTIFWDDSIIPDQSGGVSSSDISGSAFRRFTNNGTHKRFKNGKVYIDITYTNNHQIDGTPIALPFGLNLYGIYPINHPGNQRVNLLANYLPDQLETDLEGGTDLTLTIESPEFDFDFDNGNGLEIYFIHNHGGPQSAINYTVDAVRFSYTDVEFRKELVNDLHVSFDNSVNQPIVGDGTVNTSLLEFGSALNNEKLSTTRAARDYIDHNITRTQVPFTTHQNIEHVPTKVIIGGDLEGEYESFVEYPNEGGFAMSGFNTVSLRAGEINSFPRGIVNIFGEGNITSPQQQSQQSANPFSTALRRSVYNNGNTINFVNGTVSLNITYHNESGSPRNMGFNLISSELSSPFGASTILFNQQVRLSPTQPGSAGETETFTFEGINHEFINSNEGSNEVLEMWFQHNFGTNAQHITYQVNNIEFGFTAEGFMPSNNINDLTISSDTKLPTTLYNRNDVRDVRQLSVTGDLDATFTDYIYPIDGGFAAEGFDPVDNIGFSSNNSFPTGYITILNNDNITVERNGGQGSVNEAARRFVNTGTSPIGFGDGNVFIDFDYSNVSTTDRNVRIFIRRVAANGTILWNNGHNGQEITFLRTSGVDGEPSSRSTTFESVSLDFDLNPGEFLEIWFNHNLGEGQQINLRYTINSIRFAYGTDGYDRVTNREGTLNLSFDNSVNQPRVGDGTVNTSLSTNINDTAEDPQLATTGAIKDYIATEISNAVASIYAPFAHARVWSGGSVRYSVGFASITRTDTGRYEYVFDTPRTSPEYNVQAMPYTHSRIAHDIIVFNATTTGFTLQTFNDNNEWVNLGHAVIVIDVPTGKLRRIK